MPQTQERPKRIKPKGPADHLDVLTRAVFRSGISWRVVEAKWPGTAEAFGGFDPEHIANLSPADVDALASDTRLIRNRGKINVVGEQTPPHEEWKATYKPEGMGPKARPAVHRGDIR